jgi:hypothetical protein
MRMRGAWMVLGLLAACGSDEVDSNELDDSDGNCRDCIDDPEVKELNEIRSNSQVAVSPQELLFYGDLSNGTIPPEEAVVTNRTNKPVVVTAAYVADDPSSTYGGSDYFRVSGLDEAVVLNPGAKASVWVQFGSTTQQKSALLVIETNDLDDDSLLVELSGKYFSQF